MANISADYNELVARLKERMTVERQGNLESVIKKIPDVDESGQLDPRVLNIALQMKPFEGEAPEIKELKDFPVEQIRSMMGWPNHDLSRGIRTESRVIEGMEARIPVRIYTPEGKTNMPAIVFFHGGGFFGGSLAAVENPCKGLAEKAGAVVVSVDYRLAPEHPFPAGLTDCWDSVRWVRSHAKELNVNPDWIAVAGDSAGGNLSAVCALLDKENRTNLIKYQALIYPTVIMVESSENFEWKFEEYEINHHHELVERIVRSLRRGGENWVRRLYLQDTVDPAHPLVSPLLAADSSGLAEALIITAEYDALRLEGEAYAKKLSEAGVKTRIIRYCGMDHAFMDKYGIYPQAEDMMDEIASGFRRAIGLAEVEQD